MLQGRADDGGLYHDTRVTIVVATIPKGTSTMAVKRTLAVLGVAVAAACSSSTEPDNIFGRYTLERVMADDLPVRIPDGAGREIEFTGGTFELREDETCSVAISATFTDDGSATGRVDTCTFVVVEQVLFVTWTEGGGSNGTVRRDEVSLTMDNRLFLFRK